MAPQTLEGRAALEELWNILNANCTFPLLKAGSLYFVSPYSLPKEKKRKPKMRSGSHGWDGLNLDVLSGDYFR